MRLPEELPAWTVAVPLLALAVLAGTWGRVLLLALLPLIVLVLFAAVFAAVHHAEIIAHRVGEPFGTLVLAVAVTVIEVALIISLMLAGGEGAATLARDTVFATLMIVCNGALGLCLLVGGLRHRVQTFQVDGAKGALSVLTAIAVLTIIVPVYTTSTAGPTFSAGQLAFAGVSSLVLYGVFVFVQTVRHRDYFLPVDAADEGEHAAPPSTRVSLAALALLLACLVAVVGLAKVMSPYIEGAVAAFGAPQAVVGIAIALLVLLPETVAALRAAVRNRLQTSFNLSLGSALASIGLTIPVVAALSVVLGTPLHLGLGPKETVLLALTLLLSTLTVGTGRTTILQGAVHLVVFAAFLFLAIVP